MVKPRENRVPIMMSDEELKAIDDWRYENRIATRSEAIRRLCQIGLQVEEPIVQAFKTAQSILAETESPEVLSMWGDKSKAWHLGMFKNAHELAVRSTQILEISVSLRQGATVDEAMDTAASEKERFEKYFRMMPKETDE